MSLKGNQYEEKQRPIPPAGTQIAICYAIIDMGTHLKAYKGQEPEKKPLVYVMWEFPQLPEVVFDQAKGSQRLAIFQEYTVSLGDKAKLPKMLKSWRGVSEIKDLEKELPQYLGAPCMINVIHAPSKKTQGIVYANVANGGEGVMRLMQGLPHPGQPKNPKIFFELNTDKGMDWTTFHTLPTWIQKKIKDSFEFPIMLSKFGPEPPNPNAQSQNTQPVYNNTQPVYQNQNNGFNPPQNQNQQNPVQNQNFQQNTGFNQNGQYGNNNQNFQPPVQNNVDFTPPVNTDTNEPPPF